MNRLVQLHRDTTGATAVEFAMGAPLLIAAIFAIAEFSMLFWANAGMQHALGEGARYATLYDRTTASHVPTDDSIRTVMNSKVFGPNGASFTASVSTPSSSTCTNCRLLSISYTRAMNFIFFSGPAITLTRSKQVYVVS